MSRPAGSKNVTPEERLLRAKILIETAKLNEELEAKKATLKSLKGKLNVLVKDRRKDVV